MLIKSHFLKQKRKKWLPKHYDKIYLSLYKSFKVVKILFYINWMVQKYGVKIGRGRKCITKFTIQIVLNWLRVPNNQWSTVFPGNTRLNSARCHTNKNQNPSSYRCNPQITSSKSETLVKSNKRELNKSFMPLINKRALN